MRNLEVRIRSIAASAWDLAVVPGDIPQLTNGGILCKARWLTADPVRAAFPPPRPALPGEVVPALGVCEVIASRNDVFNVGQLVVLECGLSEMCVSDGRGVWALHPGQSPVSTALGLLGPPGMTAYFALTDVAAVRGGDTVLVGAASSVPGAMAGQVAVLKGARAIGIEDTSEKCVWAVRHGGFSACINRRSESLNDRLWQLAPQGFDIFFDTTDEWLGVLLRGQHLAPGARVVSCTRPGSGPQGRTPGQGGIRIAYLDPAGYQVRRGAFLKDAIAWYGAGRLTCREDIAEGIERAPEQLGRALRGECFGNPLIKL
jgi:NADPH-dependent curcumin reductase CurA